MSKYAFSMLLRKILNTKLNIKNTGKENLISLPVVCVEDWKPIFETNEMFSIIQDKIKRKFRKKHEDYNGIQSRRIVYKVSEESLCSTPIYLMLTEYKIRKSCIWIRKLNTLGEFSYDFKEDKKNKSNYYLKPDYNFVVKNGTGLGLGDYKVVY